MLRKTIDGVADEATLGAIVQELGRDREVRGLDDGSIEAVDDMGFVLGFQVTVRRPLGCHVEYDADMDRHDGQWQARAVPMSAGASQLFLFQQRDKWAPGGPLPGAAGAGERH
jgi:hypothetical protein